jgi:hypothetical protein
MDRDYFRDYAVDIVLARQRLLDERAVLVQASKRIDEIDAEVAALTIDIDAAVQRLKTSVDDIIGKPLPAIPRSVDPVQAALLDAEKSAVPDIAP